MLILSIDTCGPLGSVALARVESNEVALLGQTELPGKSYSAQLMPAIRELLATHSGSVAGLGAIVVTSGPGSFTGIRIGLSTTKGLAELRSTPILAVSRLAVLAHKAGTLAAALDASRGEFYFGDYSGEPAESLLSRETFAAEAAALAENLAVCEASARKIAVGATLVLAPSALDAIRLALPRLRRSEYDDPVTLDGNYLRRSDAEIFARPKLVPQTSA